MNRKMTLVSASLVGALSLFSQTAKADDWGCQVLLCLSDPRGPTTESECKPPIHKLWDHLRKGKPFPTCDMAVNSRNGKRSYAQLVYEPYDPCPDGTKPAGGYIAQSQSTERKDWRWLQYEFSTHGRNSYEGNGPRACVGNHLGTTYSAYTDISVQVYDRVVWQQPHLNPRAIDVFIDEVFHHRVRY
ncbi:hypothetical protein OCK05_004384 [Salmonella enterica subsp. enterica serovar Kentucky]|nr:hypothetical protein [Salmonella enterica subsp. enterica serovar Kentucky]